MMTDMRLFITPPLSDEDADEREALSAMLSDFGVDSRIQGGAISTRRIRLVTGGEVTMSEATAITWSAPTAVSATAREALQDFLEVTTARGWRVDGTVDFERDGFPTSITVRQGAVEVREIV